MSAFHIHLLSEISHNTGNIPPPPFPTPGGTAIRRRRDHPPLPLEKDRLPRLVPRPAGAAAEVWAVAEMSDWQPIETAPKDGTLVLLFQLVPPRMTGADHDIPHIYISSWWKGNDLNPPNWKDHFLGQPTHWMPLPKPPSPSP